MRPMTITRGALLYNLVPFLAKGWDRWGMGVLRDEATTTVYLHPVMSPSYPQEVSISLASGLWLKHTANSHGVS